MYGPLVRSLIEQRPEGALRAARTQHLAKQARASRRLRVVRASGTMFWGSMPSLLRGIGSWL